MTDGSDVSAIAKSDPETVVLRGNPARVVRFRKGAIVALFGVSSLAVVGVAWIGLRPPTFRMVSSGQDKIEPALPPVELAGAPKGYGEVPQLGAPLPGDLGRPILEHQRAVMATQDGTGRADQAAEAERQRAAADLKAARESGVLVQVAGVASHVPAAAANPAAMPSDDMRQSGEVSSQASLDPARDPNAQQRKLDFVKGSPGDGDVNPHRLTQSPSPYTLSAGSIMSASLITGLNSDLPGLVTAQVTENAYDSATGKVLLVPQGARLIGRYDSVVAFGQSRALVVWERLLMPDGTSIRIDNVPATDASGFAGLSDQIDRHSWQILKGVALSTLLGVGTELTFQDNESDLVAALRESAQLNGSRAGDQLVGRSLNIQPTIRVRPGWPLRVVVHKDMVLRPWTGAQR